MPVNEQKDSLHGAGLSDLYFLLVYILNRRDGINDWVFDRCREVQAQPDSCLDLWSREHYKSTIITFALTIQDVLKNPEITTGIFSHTRPMAKAFLKQIKNEFEQNEVLKKLYPEVLYADPKRESEQWSDDGGIIVKRKGNAKEATIEAWGVVDGQPTSKHFGLLVYDDVVTRESVTSVEQIHNVTEAIKLSFNLGKRGGKKRMIGTRYSAGDSYGIFIEEKIFTPRIHAATEDGKPDGQPVFLSREELAGKRRDMGIYL
ncbi:MAG: hypothetical protein LBL00_06920, partial [Endomicrobium sp.]|nr:hypothetical protein [Endomicrobium sp.]